MVSDANWRIPLADVDFGVEEQEALAEVLESKWLTMGAVTQQFEADFSKFTGAAHTIAVTNGTAALHLALMALGIGPNDEVIVPSLSFVATANAVRYCGAKAVFADVISLNDLTISPEAIDQAITPKTRAIIVMHYGGYPCNMEAITALAQQRGLFVVEDAAHALGSSLEDRHMGTWGDMGCFSFFPNKNMTTGEGGMVICNDPKLAERLRLLRSHGMSSLTWDRHRGHAWSYDVLELGYNYRIDEIRSALGIKQLKKLKPNNARRRLLSEKYRYYLNQETPEVIIPFDDPRGESACHIMPVLLPDGNNRGQVMAKMKEQGIQTSIHYPPIHNFTYYCQAENMGNLEQTETISSREMTLPLYPGMSENDVALVAASLKIALDNNT